MSGRCRFCGCTEERACPGGCSWVNRELTICSACARIDRAWQLREVERNPNLMRAFARGFMVATHDPRATDAVNPYSVKSSNWHAWQRGYDAGRGSGLRVVVGRQGGR